MQQCSSNYDTVVNVLVEIPTAHSKISERATAWEN